MSDPTESPNHVIADPERLARLFRDLVLLHLKESGERIDGAESVAINLPLGDWPGDNDEGITTLIDVCFRLIEAQGIEPDAPKCEGCSNPATTSDSEGVDLCDACNLNLVLEALRTMLLHLADDLAAHKWADRDDALACVARRLARPNVVEPGQQWAVDVCNDLAERSGAVWDVPASEPTPEGHTLVPNVLITTVTLDDLEPVEQRRIREERAELKRWQAWAEAHNLEIAGPLDHDQQLRENLERRMDGWRRVTLPVSSNIARVDYQREAETVRVTFGSGAVYDYAGVLPEVIANWQAADSVGKFFHAVFRKSTAYQCTKVRGPS